MYFNNEQHSFLIGLALGIVMHVPICVSALILFLQCDAAYGEIFSSLADMEGLVSTEFELVKQLDNYIQEEEIRLKRLRG